MSEHEGVVAISSVERLGSRCVPQREGVTTGLRAGRAPTHAAWPSRLRRSLSHLPFLCYGGRFILPCRHKLARLFGFAAYLGRFILTCLLCTRLAHIRWALFCCTIAVLAGCGTTRWTDTPRTATEQLVIADAIDQAVSELDFSVLAGSKVFLDTSNLDAQTHRGYLVGALRQQLLVNGCRLAKSRDDAEYIVEARCGAIGTDRHDLMFGLPQITLPSFVPAPGLPAQIPELVLAKKTKQIGVVRLSVFVYAAKTGQGVWQSGLAQKSSIASNFWILGAGPFERGPHRHGMSFAGKTLRFPFVDEDGIEGLGPLPFSEELILDPEDEKRQAESTGQGPAQNKQPAPKTEKGQQAKENKQAKEQPKTAAKDDGKAKK